MGVNVLRTDPISSGELAIDPPTYLREIGDSLRTTSDEALLARMFPKYPDASKRARVTLEESLLAVESLAAALEDNQDISDINISIGKNYPNRNEVVGLVVDRLRKPDSTEHFLPLPANHDSDRAVQHVITESNIPGLFLYKLTSARSIINLVTEEYRLIGKKAFEALMAQSPSDGVAKSE